MTDALCHQCGLPSGRGAIWDSLGAERLPFCCHGCLWVARLVGSGEGEHRFVNATSLRLGLAIFFAMNTMVFSVAHYGNLLGADRFSVGAMRAMDMQRWAQLLFSLPVFFLLGVPYLWRLRDLLRGRTAGLDGLVAVGAASALGVSIVNTVRGADATYFDTVNSLLVLVTLGKLLEAKARGRALAGWQRLQARDDIRHEVRRDGVWQTVAEAKLVVGDVVRVEPGAEIPVDGEVLAGECWLRREWLTGESAPIAVGQGDEVLAGSIAIDAPLQVRATAVGDARRRERLRLALLEARQQRPSLVRLGDRCAQALLPVALCAAAIGAWLGWQHGGASEAVSRAVATLVVACPCAMGIAAPLAYWLAWAAPSRRGVWLAGPEILERLAAAQHVLFDKTGTLTSQAALAHIEYADPSQREKLHGLIAGMQKGSRHPHAQLLSGLAEHPAEVSELRIVPARGLTARAYLRPGLPAQTLRLGRSSWLRECGVDALVDDERIHFAIDAKWQLAIALREELRLGAGPALRGLTQLGVQSHLASGDHAARVAQLREQLPFASAQGEMDPQQKMARIGELQSDGVLMVGDGINDSLALAAASVGITLGAVADISLQAAHVQSAGHNPSVVPALIRYARRTRIIVWQNFAWAIGFNGIALTLGALGQLHPIAAALAMLGSSLIVLANSRRVGEFVALPQEPTAPMPALPQLEVLV